MTVRDGELFITKCFANGEDHDFEQVNKNIICASVLEVEYECLKCGHTKLEYEEIVNLKQEQQDQYIIPFEDEWLEPSYDE